MFKKAMLGGVLALATFAPATAATFNIAFDAYSNGVGVDWFGSFTAPAGGGLVETFSAYVNGLTFDEFVFGGAVLPNFAAYYDNLQGNITGVASSFTAFTANPLGPVQPALFLGVFEPGQFNWGLGTCDGAGNCAGPISGSYTISAVPVPASLPLLAVGLAGLGLAGRQRRRL